MIIDTITNIGMYKNLSGKIDEAIGYLSNNDVSILEKGIHEIEGKSFFVIVNEYITKENTDGFLEGHKKYIDLQYLVKGNEIIEYEIMSAQEIIGDYNIQNDYSFFHSSSSTKLKFKEAMIAFFFPNDLHMPGIIENKPIGVKKNVIKILI